jgi:hypothetical protein
MTMPASYYRRQAADFLALARAETNAEVKLLFLELAEGCQLQADREGLPRQAVPVPATAA